MPCWHDIPASFPVRRKATALCTVHILRLLSGVRVWYDIAVKTETWGKFNGFSTALQFLLTRVS